jgi:hypothetical protein
MNSGAKIASNSYRQLNPCVINQGPEDNMATFLSTVALTDLSEAHIARLVADGVAESRELDFKRMPYGDDREAKREFLKDVTAFAR